MPAKRKITKGSRKIKLVANNPSSERDSLDQSPTSALSSDIIMPRPEGICLCSHCATSNSPLWRRGPKNELLCNACGLYWKHKGIYRPLGNLQNRKSSASTSTAVDGTSLSEAARRNKERDAKRRSRPIVPIANSNANMFSNCPRKPKETFRTLILPQASLPGGRLSSFQGDYGSEILSKFPGINPAGLFASNHALYNIDYMLYRGRLFFQGDHVSIRGSNSKIYFAIIRGFQISEDGRKMFTFSWLIPKPAFVDQLFDSRSDGFDAAHFTLGQLHHQSEPIDSIVDVFFSPYTSCSSMADYNVANLSAAMPANPVLSRSSIRTRVSSFENQIIEDIDLAHLLCDLS